MKKSEAITKLLEFMERQNTLNGRTTCKEIIEFVENELGMMPPGLPGSELSIQQLNGDAIGELFGEFAWEAEAIECTCDARFSGVDEAEYCARGCPSCTCGVQDGKE